MDGQEPKKRTISLGDLPSLLTRRAAESQLPSRLILLIATKYYNPHM